MIAATLLSARNNPRRRCSVPTCLCPKRPASSTAKCNVCLASAVRGTSIEVDIRSPRVILLSISFRKASREPARNHKRRASALSSRISPRRMCSVSMKGLPYWLASNAEDHATSFSVNRSNMGLSPRWGSGSCDSISLISESSDWRGDNGSAAVGNRELASLLRIFLAAHNPCQSTLSSAGENPLLVT